MSRIWMAVVGILAALALSAVMAVVAVADEGGIDNKAGAALVKKNFTATSGEATIETVSGTKVICKKDTATGTVIATEYGEETVTYKECTSSGLSCKGGSGAKAGELVIPFALLTRRASQPEGEVLLLVAIREGQFVGGVFAFECTGVKVELRGSFLVPAGASKKLSKTFSFNAQQEKGKQKVLEYESEEKTKTKDTLEVSVEKGAFSQAGVAGAEEVKFEEEAEFGKGPEFRVTNTSPNKRVKAETEQTFKIQNINGINNNVVAQLEVKQAGFTHNMAEAKECAEKAYGIGATCTFQVDYPLAVKGVIIAIVDDAAGGAAISTMVGE